MLKRSDLFPFQLAGRDRIVNDEQVALLLRPGHMKTATTLTALSDLREWPALVIAPAIVADRVWSKEVSKWEHLADLIVNPINGTEKQRLKKLTNDSHIETISYEGAFWLSQQVDLSSRYRAIVFDELSKMKAAGTGRYKRLRAAAADIPIRVGLTGTPVPNRLTEIWGQMFMVAGEKPLGPTYTAFRSQYFYPTDYYQRNWELKHPSYEEEIHRRVSKYAYALPPQAKVPIPPIHINQIDLDLPLDIRFMVEKLTEELWCSLPSGTELEALAKSATANKIRQLSSGAVYYDKNRNWEEVHTAKVDTLNDLLDELQGAPALLFYWFDHELQRLKKTLDKHGRRWAHIEERDAQGRFERGELDVLLAHPASVAFGTDGLQHGGNTIIWFELPWSAELWNQGNGRLARTGQEADHVDVHTLVCGAADQRVVFALKHKTEAEEALFKNLIAFQNAA